MDRSWMLNLPLTEQARSDNSRLLLRWSQVKYNLLECHLLTLVCHAHKNQKHSCFVKMPILHDNQKQKLCQYDYVTLKCYLAIKSPSCNELS